MFRAAGRLLVRTGPRAPPPPPAPFQRRGLSKVSFPAPNLLGAPLPAAVKVVEVGPRDGLQSEVTVIPATVKVGLIRRLVEAGCPAVEATSFVSPKWVPQMADHAEVLRATLHGLGGSGAAFSVLTPNVKGLEAALAMGAPEVAVFTAASDAFTGKNLNCTVDESFRRFAPVLRLAREAEVRVRGYVSCVLGCPYAGAVVPGDVACVAARLYDMGCYEVSLGDTIGVGTPRGVEDMLLAVLGKVPRGAVAVHFHDTYGMAVANIVASLQMGVGVVDAAVGGLGGCPYARGASGNVATEDVIYLLEGLGVRTGVDLDKLLDAADYILAHLGRRRQSKVGVALRGVGPPTVPRGEGWDGAA